ncbi:MAG: hypothetical protein FWG03_09400 [Clostridiales bacterium]|nr:hypothetical protein [Clostridiales bacterium]
MKNKLSILALISLCALLIGTAACGRTVSNGLMAGASPSTSALELSYYDGEKGRSSFIYDSETTNDILKELDAVKAAEARDWSLDDITFPVYGFWICATDGSGIFAAWSNGYWIAGDGAVYSFDFDFERLEQAYKWEDKREFSEFSYFPCARYLAQDENGWSSMLLTPAEEPEPPGGITMDLGSWGEDEVSVIITNNSGAEWMYGEHYNLQVLLGGLWYTVPAVPGHWAFNDIGLIVQNGEEQEKTYNLFMYGELPAGTYRLTGYGLSVVSELS